MGNKRKRDSWSTPEGFIRVSHICKTSFALKVLGAFSRNVSLQYMFEWRNGIRGIGHKHQPKYRNHPMPLLDQIALSDSGDAIYPKQVLVKTNGQSEILLTPYLYSAWHAANQGEMPANYDTIEAWALELQKKYPTAYTASKPRNSDRH
jgi:hypothetical protein